MDQPRLPPNKKVRTSFTFIEKAFFFGGGEMKYTLQKYFPNFLTYSVKKTQKEKAQT